MEQELWSKSNGARAVERELWSESYGARAVERELWSNGGVDEFSLSLKSESCSIFYPNAVWQVLSSA